MTSRTALLIIDMQRDFCDPHGYAAQAGLNVQALRQPVTAIKKLLQAARERDILVIYTREGHRPDLSDCHHAKVDRSRHAGAPIGSRGPLGRLLVRGEYGHDIIDDLAPRPGDLILDKPGYGAFYQTDLELLLRTRAVGELVITGVTTEVCVHSTLREAIDRGFQCVTIADATAASDPRLQEAAIDMIRGEGNIFGEVLDSETMIAQWKAGGH
jgi:nicotinamidase-related amidase